MVSIIDLPAGEQISGPGLYRTPLEWYHTSSLDPSESICPGPSVSSSGLRTLALQSPHAFWKQSDLNPNRYPPKEPGPGMILGRAAHALILGDEVFEDHFIFVPPDAPRRPTKTQVEAFERTGSWSPAAAPGAAFWEAFDAKAAGRYMLTEDQYETIQRMSENLNESAEARAVLVCERYEVSMIWQDEITGIWVKSRPDTIPGQNGYDFGDLKTFAPKNKNLRRAVNMEIEGNGYAMQMALAVEGAEKTFGGDAQRCALIFAQTSLPYEVIPVDLDEDALSWGRIMNRSGLDRMARGLEKGEWPGVVEGFHKYKLSEYTKDRMIELQTAGELPAHY